MGIDVDGIVRAGGHARPAGNTLFVIEIYDPVGTGEKRARRANRDTGGVVAMVAAQDREVTPHVGERSLLYVFDPSAKFPERHLMFGFAGNRACMASDAPPVINHKAVFHSDIPEEVEV